MSSQIHDDPDFQSMLETLVQRLEDGESVGVAEIAGNRPEFLLGLQQAKQNWLAVHANTAAADAVSRSAQARKLLRSKAEFHGYRLTGLLGEGGSAMVCSALEVESGRDVAIKFLITTKVSESLLHKEAQSLIRLSRADHVVKLLHVNRIDGLPYLVMERVHGTSLAEAIDRDAGKPFAEHRILAILKGVCLALTEVDRLSTQDETICNIVHADIKPSNIMVGPDDDVTLLDFGVARLLGGDGTGLAESSLAKMVGFTSAYAVPEVMAGSSPTRASDLFQVGLVGYQLATGRNYWNVESDKRRGYLDGAAVSPGIREAVWKALSWDVTRRYQTAEQFLSDLRRCTRPPLLRTPRGLAASLGGVLLVILACLLAFHWARRTAEPRPTAAAPIPPTSGPLVALDRARRTAEPERKEAAPTAPASGTRVAVPQVPNHSPDVKELSAVPASGPRVAVLYFQNHSPDVKELSSLGKGLCSMVITDLKRNGKYDLVERVRVQEVLDELKLASGVAFDHSTAAKIGKLLGAKYLLFGSFFSVAGKFRMDARLVEVERGIVVATAGVTGDSEQFDAMAGQMVRAILADHADGRYAIAASHPTTSARAEVCLEDATEFGRALDQWDAGEKAEAWRVLRRLVEARPAFHSVRELLAKWQPGSSSGPADEGSSGPEARPAN